MTELKKHHSPKPNRHQSSGFEYILRGFSWLLKPGLKRYVFIPLVINITVFIVLFFIAGHYYEALLHWVDNLLPHWLHWLNAILWLIFVVGAILLITYTFTIIANIIGAPFNSFLADKVESMLTGSTALPNASWHDQVKDLPRSFWQQMRMLGYFLPRALICLILFFIPVINAVAGVIWFLLSAWMLALQYCDYPMGNHRMSFHDVRERLAAQRMTSLGFGAGVTILSMIPIVNFVIMPVAVIGATHYYVERLRKS